MHRMVVVVDKLVSLVHRSPYQKESHIGQVQKLSKYILDFWSEDIINRPLEDIFFLGYGGVYFSCKREENEYL